MVGFVLFEVVIAATLLMTTVAGLVKAQGANIRRYVSIIVLALVAGLSGYYVVAFDINNDQTGGFSDFVLLAYGNMTLMTIIVQVCLYVFPYERWSLQIVDFGYYAADTMIGLVLFAVLFVLSVVQLVDSLQALLLFSSELMIESRRAAQVRLFDQKFGCESGWWSDRRPPSRSTSSACFCCCSEAKHIIRRRRTSSACCRDASATGRQPLAKDTCRQLRNSGCSDNNHRLSTTAAKPVAAPQDGRWCRQA